MLGGIVHIRYLSCFWEFDDRFPGVDERRFGVEFGLARGIVDRGHTLSRHERDGPVDDCIVARQ